MKTFLQTRPALLALGLLAMVTPKIADQSAPEKIKAEIEYLRRSLAAKPDTDPQWKDARPEIEAALQQAADDVRGGRPYASLEALSDALVSFRGFECATKKTEEQLLKEGLPQVETEVKKARIDLAALVQQHRRGGSGSAPAVIRALSEKAEGEAANLIEGGRGFAVINDTGDRANDLSSALYYVGSAEAQLEVTAFYKTLHLPRNNAPILLHSISPELQRLQERTTAAFQPPRSVEHHADFIRLNATLKLAGELDAAERYAGALYQYLVATEQFGKLDAVARDAEKQSELRAHLAKLRRQLSASKQDSSIALLFLEHAEARLAKSPNADDWKAAGIIVDQVLPAYAAALTSSPPQHPPAVAGVRVTLVRWPYT